jgi:DNA helicase-2/ATP-dependent DNA helicase PcrA
MEDELNPAQRDAVRTMRGPLLILAGAGTGKTRVVTFRIARLIRRGVDPSRILAVTFTNRAAAEMQERAAALLGGRRRKTQRADRDKQRPEISTFHSLCVRILRRQIHRLGYPSNYTICDRHDQESIARGVLRELRLPGTALRPGDLIYQISRWKSDGLTPAAAAAAADTDRQHLAAAAYRRYQKTLRSKGAVDFDDMLGLTGELFDRFPAARHEEADRFDQVLIDEYQDTNDSQYRVAKGLAAEHRNLCVVGDDDQSIYGWRGANVAHILQFQRDWPDAKVIRLEENYRSCEPILALANRLIKFNRQRHAKVLRAARHGGQRPTIMQFEDAEKEARGVVDDLRRYLSQPGLQPRDFSILFRTNEQPRLFEAELRRAQLPYVLVGSMSFYDRKEVRDVLAYLKLLANPSDDTSLLRILNTPPRGIGQKAQTRLLEIAVQRGKPIWQLDPKTLDPGDVPPKAVTALTDFRHMVNRFRSQADSQPLAPLASELLDTIGYRGELARIYSDPDERDARLTAVDQVVQSIERYAQGTPKPTFQGFVDEALLGQRDEEDDKDTKLRKNAIVLITLHSAKGLEFPHVYLVGMEEGLLPHRRALTEGDSAIDEERRLCYVGVTRAQERLTLSLALSRRKWGRRSKSHASRFLFEMTGKG